MTDDKENYLSYTGLIVLYIDYTEESTATLEQVKIFATNRCTRVAEQSGVDVKCYVTDHHNGNKYVAYSDQMVKKYSVLGANWQLDLDMEAINNIIRKGNNLEQENFNIESLESINEKLNEIISVTRGGWLKNENGTITLMHENGEPYQTFTQKDKNGQASFDGNWALVPVTK